MKMTVLTFANRVDLQLRIVRFSFVTCLLILVPIAVARAQEGYDFEVLGPELPARGATALELHTNTVVVGGHDSTVAGVWPTEHALRTSLELNHSFTDWLNTGIYTIGYARDGTGVAYVGTRVRLTTAPPPLGHWPVHIGLAQELTHVSRAFAPASWEYELIPVLGVSAGAWAVAVNPTLARAFGGGEQEIEFEPRARVGYRIGGDDADADDAAADPDAGGAVSVEYFGAVGPLTAFEPTQIQRHYLFAAVQLPLRRCWTLGFGIGKGLTRASERLLLRAQLSYHMGPEG